MRLAVASFLVAAALAGCGGTKLPPAKPGPPSGPDLSIALAPLTWLRGDWERLDAGGVEHWVATAGVFYGIAFGADGGFEVMILDDADEAAEGKADGTLRFYAMPGGAAATEFTRIGGDAHGMQFENPQHDDPTGIAYAPAGGALVATLHGPGGDTTIEMHSTTGERAPEVEAADVAFARDTDRDRADGWVKYFAEDGAMMRKGQRIEGADAIRGAIAPLLAHADLIWAPVWSRMSPDGRLAVTVGRARVLEQAAVTWRGSYVTIWRNDGDGWKVVFDVGRSENDIR